ncbi:MAG: adenylate/guanylate cyclase domain-containing protein [Acidimicrobiia bacterium]|nr:MAG: adenylate/guanylate cyclase domain-containing protein [Acidimicrobiia bacterium]
MHPPEVKFARSGDTSIAYSVVGDGPIDLVFVGGWVLSSLEHAWEGPAADFFSGLAAFSRLILFDKRGTGLSDRVSDIPDLETRMDDVRAVMDAVASPRAAVMGFSEGGPMTLLFAATYPERTAATVLFGSGASYVRADDYPWAPTSAEWDAIIEKIDESEVLSQEWLDRQLQAWAPSVADDETIKQWWRRWVLTSASPGALASLRDMNRSIDARHTLDAIHAPTLVIGREGDTLFSADESRYLAARIADAKLIVLEGEDHAYFVDPDPVVEEVASFLTDIWDRGDWDMVKADRVLATVLFTDIVDSTALMAQLGDRGWSEVLEKHNAFVRRQLTRYSGKEVSTAGDSFFARFDGPARAIHCASAIVDGVREFGLEVRAGLHTGECELIDDDVRGIAVHIGARVTDRAGPGEVLVSRTVKDLVAGSGIEFDDRGEVALKGVPGDWSLYSVRT